VEAASGKLILKGTDHTEKSRSHSLKFKRCSFNIDLTEIKGMLMKRFSRRFT